jgi:arylsulfatase A-like enzyme
LQPGVDFYRDQYEESVSYLDAQLGEFLQSLASPPASENVAVIFTGDHGESFERGYMNHGEELYETSTHVPLVIRFPNQSRGMRLAGLAQSVDIAPTILSVAGVEVPRWMDGRALGPDKIPQTDSTVAVNFKDPVGQTTYPLPTKLAIWSKPFKLIQNCQSGHAALYNWRDDPREKVDLLRSAPAGIVEKLRRSLNAKLDKQTKGPKMTCAGSGG